MNGIHLFVLAPLLLLGGCAASSVNQNYGNAYEQMVREQTFDVSTRNTGQGDRVLESTDPDYANKVVEEMRKDVADRKGMPSGASTSQSGSSGGSGGGSSGGMSGGGGGSQ